VFVHRDACPVINVFNVFYTLNFILCLFSCFVIYLLSFIQ
jgi:hypothetical protein